MMTAEEARAYLGYAAKTFTGQRVLRAWGLQSVIDNPKAGDDDNSIELAQRLRLAIEAVHPPALSEHDFDAELLAHWEQVARRARRDAGP